MAVYTVSIGDGSTLSSLAVSAGRGPKGDGFTGGTYDAGTGKVTFTSNDGIGFETGDLRGDLTEPGPIGSVTPNTGAFTSLTVDTDTLYVDSANNRVGIGTSSPATLLHLNGGASTPEIRLQASSFTSNLAGFKLDTTGARVVTSSSSAYPLAFDTNSSEAMRIDSSGNVGIGTSSPAQKLHVAEPAASAVGPELYLQNNIDNASSGHAAQIRFNLRAFESTTRNALIGAVAEDGFGANPSLYFSTSSGSSGEPTERMRIDSSGNVGIGTSSPGTPLQVAGRIRSIAASGSNGFQIGDFGADAGTFKVEAVSGRSLTFVDDYAGSERMRIDSSGNLLVGTTSLPSGSSFGFGVQSIADGTIILNSRNSTSGSNQVAFFNPNGLVGTISTSGTTTSYNTSSDERLKENIADAQSASDLIDGIQVREFDWKADGEHQRYGMVAQELETVAPEAVTKGESEDDMWAVDYSKLVPMLVKEIQDLRKRVSELENTQ